MTRYRIIANPAAGKGAGEKAIPRIERILAECGKRPGLDFDLVRTEGPWHAAELARESAEQGYDVVVAAGGDGTANEVLNGLMEAKQAGVNSCAMGVLCIGRGNDFAFGAGIPTDLEGGCKALARGQRRVIDVGRVTGGFHPEGRYFGNGIGIGFDATAGFEANKFTRLGGFLSYIVAVLKTILLYHKSPLVKIEYNGQAIIQSSMMISVMNGRRMGGGFLMAPQGEPDDGLFDLCIAGEVGRIRIFGLVPHFLRGTQATQKPIKTGRAPAVVVTAIDGVLPAHADGETLCVEGRRLELELLPARLEIVCGPAEAAE